MKSQLFTTEYILHRYKTYDASQEEKEIMLFFLTDLTGNTPEEILEAVKKP